MKRWLVCLILTCFIGASTVSQALIVGQSRVAAGGGPTCGALTFVGAPGDTETAENTSGDFCTTEFSETDASGYIDTYSTAAYHGGSHSIEFANTATAASLTTYIVSDLGSTDAGFSLTFWWKSPNNGTVYSNATFFAASNSATSTQTSAHNGTILWDGNGANGKIAWNTEGASGQVLSTNTFAYNNWYKFVINYTDGGSSTLDIYNSSNSLIETLTKTLDTQAPRYFYWYDDTNMSANTYLDDIQYDSTNP